MRKIFLDLKFRENPMILLIPLPIRLDDAKYSENFQMHCRIFKGGLGFMAHLKVGGFDSADLIRMGTIMLGRIDYDHNWIRGVFIGPRAEGVFIARKKGTASEKIEFYLLGTDNATSHYDMPDPENRIDLYPTATITKKMLHWKNIRNINSTHDYEGSQLIEMTIDVEWDNTNVDMPKLGVICTLKDISLF
jgi:hypothetical protein